MTDETTKDINREANLTVWAELSPLVMVAVLCVGTAIGFHAGVQFDRSDATRYGLGRYHADPQTGDTQYYWVVGGAD